MTGALAKPAGVRFTSQDLILIPIHFGYQRQSYCALKPAFPASRIFIYNYHMNSADWMNVAKAEIGVKTFPDGKSNPRIEKYHRDTNIDGYDDKAAWCSSFANWVLAESGCTGTNSALARSWLDWGVQLEKPRFGCVVILERENPDGWQGHVGFFLKIEDEKIALLGGNQLDEVREHVYPLSTVLGYRWPTSLP